MRASEIVALDRVDFTFGPWDWPFAAERRAAIDAHFAAARALKPQLWNGQVLLMRDIACSGGVLSGACFAVDFASFMAWHAWGRPPAGISNVFAMAALRAADGAFLLGRMGAHTANAGEVYFPAGTPDLADVVDGRLDLEASVWRELVEETGLGPGDVEPAPGWIMVTVGAQRALMKSLRVPLAAAALRARIRGHLDAQAQPELSDIVIARGEDDIGPSMPPFVAAFLHHVWSR